MALPEDNKPVVAKSPNSGSQKPEKREKPSTKVVIRRLPPSLEKDSLLNQISPLPDYDYFYLVNGEAALGENAFSRAYINFINIDDVYEFKERFDNYVFLDQKGNEYPAVVEFAPFQKIPKKRNKMRSDPKCGTIENDPYYLEFLEYLKKPKEQEDKPEYSYHFSSDNKGKDDITTPLLEFVRSRRAERMRIREERREERKRKEKKIKEDEKRKRSEEKFLSKSFSKMKLDSKDLSDNEEREILENDVKTENQSDKSYSYKNKDRKFDERKRNTKVASPREDFMDKKEFKNRKEHYKEPKADTMKKDEKLAPKKPKKYSEKKEERKMEAQKKAEEMEKKITSTDISNKSSEPKSCDENSEKSSKLDEVENSVDVKVRSVDEDGRSENNGSPSKTRFRKVAKTSKICESKSSESVDSNKEHKKERIRNKDRPTIAIYRPGMLSKRKLTDADDSNKDAK